MSASLRVIPSYSLRHRVAETLREAIATGRFRTGERLLEGELTGVDRTCVREALRQLESEGLVTSMPNRGPIVTPIGLAEGRDIYDVRIMLEGLAARLFATRTTPAQLEDVAATVAEPESICSAALTDPTRPRARMVEVHAILAALHARDEESASVGCTMHVRRSAAAAPAELEHVQAAASGGSST